jgi:hypothetical protein
MIILSQEYNENSKFLFFGQTFEGTQAFADEYTSGDLNKANDIIPVLIKKGSLQVMEVKSPVQKHFEQVAAEELISQTVDMLNLETEMGKDLKAKKNRENRLTYPGISVDCSTYSDAVKLMSYCNTTLRLKEISINTDNNGHHVIIKNITDAEINAVNRYYTGMKLTAGVQTGMQKSVDTVTKTVDYATQNIIAPAAQIGVKGVVNIFKSLAKVGAKVGSTTITATSQGIQQTKLELMSDPDVLRAANELIGAKDALKRKTMGNTSSGITMLNG